MSKLNEWSAENLERAAKHMRELDKSTNAKAAIELAKREQDVEMAREAARGKEAEAQRATAMTQLERVRWEEQRRTLEVKRENEKAAIDHRMAKERELEHERDQLARKRDEDIRRKALEDERIKVAIRKQAEEELQAEKRRTEEHRARLERENMKARAIAEAEGRIKEQRDNEDVLARQMKLRMEMERVTRLEAISATFKNLSALITDFITDSNKVTTTVLAITAAAAGVYATRESARVVGRVIEKRLGTPSLVRETSRSTAHFAWRKRLGRAIGVTPPEEGSSLADVVLRKEISDRVARLAVAVANTRAHAAPYRNMLLYGPPGTGKTMVAKRLARSSGMDYAIMSGGDVGPLGRDAVTELHKLFDWANTSRRGLLLFIDEADAFLGSRSRTQLSEDQRNALNALLFRTGESSKRFMLVLATNRPGDLDRAVSDRVDEAIVFDLPDEAARQALVKQYFNMYIERAGEEARRTLTSFFTRATATIRIDPSIDDAYLASVATRTVGFSGREISKLMISVQGNVYGSGSTTLTKDVFEETLRWKILEHKAKNDFGSDAFDFVAAQQRQGSTAASSLATPAVAGAGAKSAQLK